MKILDCAVLTVLLIVSTCATAQVFKCTGPDGKRVFTDQPCADSVPQPAPADAVPAKRVPASQPSLVTPVPAARPPAPVASNPVKSRGVEERSERDKFDNPRTPEEKLAKKKYMDDYRLMVRAQMQENLARVDQACKKGDAKACEVLKQCDPRPGAGCVP